MLKRVRFVSHTYEIVRVVCVYVVAIAVLAGIMAFVGWQISAIATGLLIAVIAGATIFEVRRAARDLHGQSRSARKGAAEAERHYVDVLRKIISFVEGRECYWRGHSKSVGRLAREIARRMNLPEELCQKLELAGQLHDIGLLAIPEVFISGAEGFGIDEFRSLQKHSEASHEVLRPLLMLADVLPAIRAHHERMNGTGYPDGLAGEDIPLGGRILAVADSYDAMTHDRPGRSAMSPLAAMRELGRCSPAGYDPACVEALAEVLNVPALEEAWAAARAMCRI